MPDTLYIVSILSGPFANHLTLIRTMTTLRFGAICATVGLLLLLVSKLVASRKRKLEAARRGCGRLSVVPGNDFLGITRLRQFLQARREKRALPWMLDLMDSAGQDVHTAKDTIAGHSFIWTRDTENSRAVLASQADDFDIGRTRQESLLCVVGSGIFTRTGHPWRESRAFLRPQFMREQVSSLDPLENHFQALLKVIKVHDDGWTSNFDIQPLIFNHTLDVATEFLFGTSANAQAASAAGVSAEAGFHFHFDSAAKYTGIRASLGRYFWMYNPKKFQKHCDIIHAYADGYVHAAIERQQQRKQQEVADEKSRFVLLDELVDITNDRIRLRSESLNVLGPARTSTASLIQWVLYFLARHPSTFNKLRTIILSDFGSFGNREKITFDGLKRCEFLTHCVNESLRICPVIPVHIRSAARDTTLPRGGGANGKDPIFVPKGTEIRQVVYGMCMQTDIWGEDTATFRPERFENRKLSSDWIPFGSGPRMCLGRK